ncbi:hypothetical protein AOLI_G00067270 [Acnodon oligacanthus]
MDKRVKKRQAAKDRWSVSLAFAYAGLTPSLITAQPVQSVGDSGELEGSSEQGDTLQHLREERAPLRATPAGAAWETLVIRAEKQTTNAGRWRKKRCSCMAKHSEKAMSRELTVG